jgi:fibronectin type 3 domain-containing protein
MKIFLKFVASSIFVLSLGCSSSTDSGKIDRTPPAVPYNLEIVNIGNGAVSLSWTPSKDTDLKGYNVYWLGWAQVDTLNANRKSFDSSSAVISNLDYETMYYFGVSAIDKSGNESAISVQITGKPQNTTSPLPPSNTEAFAENIDFPTINVFWAPNTEPDLDHYEVFRGLSPNGGSEDSLKLVASVTEENFKDAAVEVGIKYYYKVTAVDKGGWSSPYSAIVSDQALPFVKIISPKNYEYTDKNPTFKWNPVEGATSYNLILTTSRIGGEIWNVTLDSSKSQVVYSGKTKLINGNTYYWKLGTISKSEINSISQVGTFVIQSK